MSRKVVLFIASSLDGFIAGSRHEIDWLFTDQDYGFTPFDESVDTVVMGYRTYQLSVTFPTWPHPGKKVYVLTRKKRKIDSRVTFVRQVSGLVKKLKQEKGKHIWLVGGGQINGLLLNRGEIDELILSIHPVVLGKGIPLFSRVKNRHEFKVVKVQSFGTGLVQVHYECKKK